MTLTEALTATTALHVTTPRKLLTPAIVSGGHLRIFNGVLAARAPLNRDHGEFAVAADRFAKVWTEASRAYIEEPFVVVKRGRVSFRVLKLDPNLQPCPEFIPPRMSLAREQQACIQAAAPFMSANAMYPWACGVNLTSSGVVATNNQCLVFVPCPFDYELTLPKWAVEMLPTTPEDIQIGWNDNAIAFHFANGLVLQTQRLTAEMPPSVGQLAAEAAEAAEAADPVPEIAGLMAELQQLGGRYCTLSPGMLSVDGDNGEQAVADAGVRGSFRMTIETAKLVLPTATHIDFDCAPDKLRFSKNTFPRIRGFAAGMR